MKQILGALLALLSGLVLAQTTASAASTNPPTWQIHPPTPSHQLAWLDSKLTLTAKQKTEIKPLLVTRYDKLKSIHADSSLTDAQKADQTQKLLDSIQKKIQAFLTPDQVTKYEAMHQHQHPAITSGNSTAETKSAETK